MEWICSDSKLVLERLKASSLKALVKILQFYKWQRCVTVRLLGLPFHEQNENQFPHASF